jgi:hypothetical protein
MFLFSLFLLRQDFTNETWEASTHDPSINYIFALCYVDWCPHCHKALPDWGNFQSETVADPDFVAGTIDCTHQAKFCQNLSVSSYPTFIAWHPKSEVFKVMATRSMSGYYAVYNRLRLLGNGTFIPPLGGHPTLFPSYVFYLPPDDSEGHELVTSAVIRRDFMHNNTMFITDSADRRVVAHVDANFSVELDHQFTFPYISAFLMEHRHGLLGPWSRESIRSVARLFAVVISHDKDYTARFRPLAVKTYSKFAWGSYVVGENMTASLFNMTIDDFPAVAVIQIRKGRYSVLKNVTEVEAVEEFLGKFEGQMDGVDFEYWKLAEPKRRTVTQEVLSVVFWTVVITLPICLALGGLFVWLYMRHQRRKEKEKEE